MGAGSWPCLPACLPPVGDPNSGPFGCYRGRMRDRGRHWPALPISHGTRFMQHWPSRPGLLPFLPDNVLPLITDDGWPPGGCAIFGADQSPIVPQRKAREGTPNVGGGTTQERILHGSWSCRSASEVPWPARSDVCYEYDSPKETRRGRLIRSMSAVAESFASRSERTVASPGCRCKQRGNATGV